MITYLRKLALVAYIQRRLAIIFLPVLVFILNTAPQNPFYSKLIQLEEVEERLPQGKPQIVKIDHIATIDRPISKLEAKPIRNSPKTLSANLPTSKNSYFHSIELKNKYVDANLDCLAKAYPEFISSVDKNTVIWIDGTRMEFDDYLVKSGQEKIESADLEDQVLSLYIAGKPSGPPAPGDDPGRIRYAPFFKKMYGSTRKEVISNLDTVYWLKHTINTPMLATRINGVSKKLQAISNELEGNAELIKYLAPPAGTFNWRVILNTNRLSAHSYGIAVDINVNFSNYWAWSKSPKYRNQIPWEIIEVFEKYGFIWGGKWYHYDTMHFEYRPELFSCRKAAEAALEFQAMQ